MEVPLATRATRHVPTPSSFQYCTGTETPFHGISEVEPILKEYPRSLGARARRVRLLKVLSTKLEPVLRGRRKALLCVCIRSIIVEIIVEIHAALRG